MHLGMFVLRRKGFLEKHGITHIVSVLIYDFKDYRELENYKHLQINALDVDDENLLAEFEKTGKWVEDALEAGGKVLVHCAMGKSRSVTITIAFLLRKYPDLTVTSALELVKQARPMAEPNDGFMAQLKLYKLMGCPRNIKEQPKYQRWLYKIVVDEALAAGMAPDKVRFEDEQNQEVDGENHTVGVKRELRCKRCRRTLVNSTYLVSHDPSSTLPSSSACTHHFLHPLSWMRLTLSQGLLAGRLECPNTKCDAQIGRYAWQGMQCSCGVWVCPAFSLQKGRVDEIILSGKEEGVTACAATDEVLSKMKGLGIRLPPGMRGPNREKEKENL
ncbi:protein-tyrosine phosphatase-like protein [Amylocarpus encephaloides]|uniref:protein-tyrosine-phosphatase n=1 Tax=Amylocarpus encephaloides TaxID=45428 RepID=A0A9P8CAQ8_9HELO|nr:protein-tyrosine phosphatase-like protein [Amylocarpus encephaloides]